MKTNILAAGEGNPQDFFGTILDWKATSRSTGGAPSLVEAHGFHGVEPPIHYHENADEFFYVVRPKIPELEDRPEVTVARPK